MRNDHELYRLQLHENLKKKEIIYNLMTITVRTRMEILDQIEKAIKQFIITFQAIDKIEMAKGMGTLYRCNQS